MSPVRFAALIAMTLGFSVAARAQSSAAATNSFDREFALIASGKFSIAPETAKRFQVRLTPPATGPVAAPFTQAAVKHSTAPVRFAPDPRVPYFNVRFALPIPPDNDTNLTGKLTGLDPFVWAHNHSPGFEILPNGDALAIYFSAAIANGASESAPSARFVQARWRHGTEQWDPPELFFDSRDFNDQSALLWTDGNTIRFFGGGREISPWIPFKMATSTDNGATWTFSLPLLDKPAADHTPQPIVNAFRDAKGAIYFPMDAEKNESFLWRSTDGGVHWQDMRGRTGGRHSTIVPVDEKGMLLSIGGKNTGINGYSPQNTSADWGATWSTNRISPFPALGGNQRPSLIRLANGNLCFVSDSYHRSRAVSPEGWSLGEGCFVAISKDQGATWRFKRLPVELPHERDRKHGTLGYATVRQAPNGVIHVLATMTHPCLHYEFNEAWVFSDARDIQPEGCDGRVGTFSERYSNGAVRAEWSARICLDGRYLLDGKETTYYENGRKEHEAAYINGRKTGEETFWDANGVKLWSWTHDLEKNVSVWTHYYENGRKRIESTWNTRPRARDIDRTFNGLEAEGPATHFDRDGKVVRVYHFTKGALAGERSMSRATVPDRDSR